MQPINVHTYSSKRFTPLSFVIKTGLRYFRISHHYIPKLSFLWKYSLSKYWQNAEIPGVWDYLTSRILASGGPILLPTSVRFGGPPLQNTGLWRAHFTPHINTFWGTPDIKHWHLEGPFYYTHQNVLVVLRIYPILSAIQWLPDFSTTYQVFQIVNLVVDSIVSISRWSNLSIIIIDNSSKAD